MEKKRLRRLEVFLEFLIFGLIMGVTEDIIAVKIATGAPITWKIFWIVLLIAIPFAIIGELIVDKWNFLPFLEKLFVKEEKAIEKRFKKMRKK
jgi:hypothetical protein